MASTGDGNRMHGVEESLLALQSLGFTSGVRHQATRESAATISWGVAWDEEMIARDLMQNYFDANVRRLHDVRVTVDGNKVSIYGPEDVNLKRLFYLGSEKSEADIGQYGEGFKAAATCLLRDHGIEPVAFSGMSAVVIRIAPEKIQGTELQPILYDFFELDTARPGTTVVLRGCSKRLVAALQVGLQHFMYDGNPLVGPRLWRSWNGSFSIYQSTSSDGFVFYRRLRRGVIPEIPVVLSIEKEYAKLEKLVAQDRDRKGFGEKVLRAYYSVMAQNGLRDSPEGQRAIVERARHCWTHGHPLLSEIAGVGGYYRAKWKDKTVADVFGSDFFARADQTKDAVRQSEYERIEREWLAAGRQRLPSYFARFGLVSAESYLADLERKDRDAVRRGPTDGERHCIELLQAEARELMPDVMTVFGRGGVTYTVAPTTRVLGEYKKQRPWSSHEIFLAAGLFDADFAHAFSVFLHEHAHVFGHDGSRNFTDALTELLGTTIRMRDKLDAAEAAWNKAKDAVLVERSGGKNEVDDDLDGRVDAMSLVEARGFLKRIPPAQLRSMLEDKPT